MASRGSDVGRQSADKRPGSERSLPEQPSPDRPAADRRATDAQDEQVTLALVDRCLAGNEAAMLDLVDRFRGQVFGLCYRMLEHQQDAEDAAQETFARAFRSLKRYDRERAFRPWLLAIAGNRCRTMLAARMRVVAPKPLVAEPPDGRENQQAAQHLAEELNLALGTLRAEYRQAFLLLHEQNLSYAEIAAALECPVGTVKTWVHRARQELTQALRQRGVFAEPRDETTKPTEDAETG